MTEAHSERGSLRLPIFQGLLPFKTSQVGAEVIAGITLAALAVPEVMGYTKIAGTPVITGLYTMLLPMVLFAVFGSSRHLVVSADSATAAILAAGLVGVASVGSDQYVALASLLALMAAAFLFLARVMRLGFLADFLSATVLVGFLTGVGVQVALGQVGGMLGVEAGGHGTLGKLAASLALAPQANPYAVVIAVAVLALIVGAKKLSPRIPGALISVIGALVASWWFDLESHGVKVLGVVPSGLPGIGLPDVDWSWSLVQQLAPIAFAMFIVILAQSAATSRAYAARYHERFSENVDLVGLGMANVGAGLTGTFVVAGSPTKTQMVDGAGGRTQLTHLVAVFIVVMVLLFLTDALAYMPEAVLAAIVFHIGLDLIKFEAMRDIYRRARSEFWVALVTAAAVVLVGVEQGIILAMVLSLLEHIRRGYRPKNTLVVRSEQGWETMPVESLQQFEPGLMVYRFSHSIYYANAQQFEEQVLELAGRAEPAVEWLCVDAAAIADVDYSAAAMLRSVHQSLEKKGIRLVFGRVPQHTRHELDRLGITELVGPDAFYPSGSEVLRAWRGRGR